MAAIVQPHRHPHRSHGASPRPALRLVEGGATSSVRLPDQLGITPLHVVVAVAAFVALLLGSLAVGSGALASLAPAPERPVAASAAPAATDAVVEVQPGDSIWTVARRLQPAGDVRPLVDRLLAANGATVLQPGDQLIVPS